MRNVTNLKAQANGSAKLSPELNELMHMLAMLDHQFTQQPSAQNGR